MKNSGNYKNEIILSLIKDDLVNSRLMSILHKAGLNPTNYCLNLKDTIFKLAGLSGKRESILSHYNDAIQIVSDVDIFSYPEILDRVAESIYKELTIKLSVFNEECN
jgi:hypothetical protein